MARETFHVFDSAEEACKYRVEHGTGGWIFKAEEGIAILFPPKYTAAMVFAHVLTTNRHGKLV